MSWLVITMIISGSGRDPFRGGNVDAKICRLKVTMLILVMMTIRVVMRVASSSGGD